MSLFIPDLPFPSRRKKSTDQVGPGTFYPIKMSRQQLCDLYWKTKTVNVDVQLSAEWTIPTVDGLGQTDYSLSVEFSGESPWAWHISAIPSQPNSYLYEKVDGVVQSDSFNDPEPMAPAARMVDLLTWYSLKKDYPEWGIDPATGLATLRAHQPFVSHGAEVDAVMSYTQAYTYLGSWTTTTHTFMGSIAGGSCAIADSLVGYHSKLEGDWGYVTTSSGGGGSSGSNHYDEIAWGSGYANFDDSSFVPLLYETDRYSEADEFWVQLILRFQPFTLFPYSLYCTSLSSEDNPFYVEIAPFDFFGHSVPMWAARGNLNIPAPNFTGSVSVTEEMPEE